MYLSAWLHMYVPLYLNVEIWYTSFQPFLVHTVSYETLFFPLWVMTLLLHAWDKIQAEKAWLVAYSHTNLKLSQCEAHLFSNVNFWTTVLFSSTRQKLLLLDVHVHVQI